MPSSIQKKDLIRYKHVLIDVITISNINNNG